MIGEEFFSYLSQVPLFTIWMYSHFFSWQVPLMIKASLRQLHLPASQVTGSPSFVHWMLSSQLEPSWLTA